jgi:hypothetical protein
MRQQAARRRGHWRTIKPLERHKRWQRADVVGHQIGTGIDRRNAWHRSSDSTIDGEDLGVRMRREQHMQPQRTVFRLVVDEMPLPGQEPLVLETLDRLARTETHTSGKNIHQAVR